jgi:hypothetical protein
MEKKRIKKPYRLTGRVLLVLVFTSKKAKGEEKPEEELMGKRKSSPRLATTSPLMLLLLSCPFSITVYITENKKLGTVLLFPDLW